MINLSSNPKKNKLLSTVLTYISCVFMLKTLSLSLELVYRHYCYPLTLYGFFLSLITSTSNVCNYIRTANTSIESYLVQFILSIMTYGLHTFFGISKDLKTSKY